MKSTTTQQSTQQDPSITSHLGSAVIASGCWPRSGAIGDDINKALKAVLRDHFDSGSFGMAVLYPDDAAIYYSVIDKSAMTELRADKTLDAVSASEDRHQEITGSPYRVEVTPFVSFFSDDLDPGVYIFWDDLDAGIFQRLSGDVLRDDRGEFLSLNLNIMADDE